MYSRLGYSPCVRPALINGIKSVIVDQHLRETDGQAYNNFLLGFARENDLVTEDGDTSSI